MALRVRAVSTRVGYGRRKGGLKPAQNRCSQADVPHWEWLGEDLWLISQIWDDYSYPATFNAMTDLTGFDFVSIWAGARRCFYRSLY